MRSVAGAMCSRRVIPEQVITYHACTRYLAEVPISPRIRAGRKTQHATYEIERLCLILIRKRATPNCETEYLATAGATALIYTG